MNSKTTNFLLIVLVAAAAGMFFFAMKPHKSPHAETAVPVCPGLTPEVKDYIDLKCKSTSGTPEDKDKQIEALEKRINDLTKQLEDAKPKQFAEEFANKERVLFEQRRRDVLASRDEELSFLRRSILASCSQIRSKNNAQQPKNAEPRARIVDPDEKPPGAPTAAPEDSE